MSHFFDEEHERKTRATSNPVPFGAISLGQRFYASGLDTGFVKVGAHTALEDFGYITSTAPVGFDQVSGPWDGTEEVWVSKDQLQRQKESWKE